MPRPKIDYLDDFVQRIVDLENQIKQIKSQYVNKLRYVSQSAQPTLATNGEALIWHDTDDDKIYLIARGNSGDVKIELI